MKFLNLTLLSIVSTVFLGTASAEDALPTKQVTLPFNVGVLPSRQVTLPFNNEPLISETSSSLSFIYDMSGAPAKKVVCKFSDPYKVSMVGLADLSAYYPSKGNLSDRWYGPASHVGVFFNTQTITFRVGRQEDSRLSEADIFYVTHPVGEIEIYESDFNPAPVDGVAFDRLVSGSLSCYYENETNQCIASAEDALPTKQVTLPFNNEPLFSKTNSGLSFTYDMSGAPAKKVVCKFSGPYKPFVRGPIDLSPIFTFPGADATGESDTTIFTLAEESHNVSRTISVIKVTNPVGEIKIYDSASADDPVVFGVVVDSSVSCYYENETNQ